MLHILLFLLSLVHSKAEIIQSPLDMEMKQGSVVEDASLSLVVSWYQMNTSVINGPQADYANLYFNSYTPQMDLFESNTTVRDRYLVNNFANLWSSQPVFFVQYAMEQIARVPGFTPEGLDGAFLRSCAQLFTDPQFFTITESVLRCTDLFDCVDNQQAQNPDTNDCNSARWGCVNYLTYVFEVTFTFPVNCPVGEYDPAISGFSTTNSPAEIVTNVLRGIEGEFPVEDRDLYTTSSLDGNGEPPYLVTFLREFGGTETVQLPCTNGTSGCVCDPDCVIDVEVPIQTPVSFRVVSASSPQDLRNLPTPEESDDTSEDATEAVGGIGGIVALSVVGCCMLVLSALFLVCVSLLLVLVVAVVCVVIVVILILLVVVIFAIIMVIIGTLLRIFVYSKRKPPPDAAADLNGWSDDDEDDDDDEDAGDNDSDGFSDDDSL